MIAHRHPGKGGDVKQLVLLLPDAGGADFAGPNRKDVGMVLAKRVADLVDDEREAAAGRVAEIDRERIEGIAEQAGIAEQQHAPAGELDAVLCRAALSV